MRNAPRTFTYPLSDDDLAEIRSRAARERSLAVARIFGSLAGALKSVFRFHPAGRPDPRFDVP